MEIEVHCKRVQITDTVRVAAERKAERLSRYLGGMERCAVNFADGHVGHLGEPVSCEVVLEGHGRVIRVSAVGPRPEVALELAVHKAELRLTRVKTKLVDRSRPRQSDRRAKRAPAHGSAGGSDGEVAPDQQGAERP